MKDINDFLMDESTNDKQLIKDLSVLIKNHYEKKLPINKKFVISLIQTIQSNDPDLSLDEIIFEDYDKFLAQYGDNIMYIYMTNIVNYYNYRKNMYLKGYGDKKIVGYYLLLSTVLHELTHTKQEYLYKEGKNDLYKFNYEFCRDDFEGYLDFYEVVPIERYADLRAGRITSEVLSYIFDEKDIKNFRIIELFNLKRGYIYTEEGVISPMKQFEEVMNIYGVKLNEDLTEYTDLYSRMYLGLDITKEEYEKVHNIAVSISNNGKAEDKIKKLVNKKTK